MKNYDSIKYDLSRLNFLKDTTIVLNIEKMDLENDLSLYDSLFHCFARGDLDNIFESYVFDDISEDERINLINLVKNYRGLCFYKNDPEFWLDSLNGLYFSDPELISYFIFENYDFILDLGKRYGKKSLDFLNKLSEYNEFQDYSIIDNLRNNFDNDEVLKFTISNIIEDESFFNLFTLDQISMLLTYPLGNIFEYSDTGIKFNSIFELAVSFYSESDNILINNNFNNPNNLIDELKNYFLTTDISDLILRNYYNYLNNSSRYDKPDSKCDVVYDNKYDFLKQYCIKSNINYNDNLKK